MKNVQIIAQINEDMKANAFTDKRFQKSQLFGMAIPIMALSKDKKVTTPAVMNQKGEAQAVVPDDKYNIMVYHKITGSTYQLVNGSGYGDSNKNYLKTSNMSMIVFGQRDKLKMEPDQLESLIIGGMPGKMTAAFCKANRLRNVAISFVSSNNNIQQVFNQEYANVSFSLKPQYIYFELKYKIECTFDGLCINTCEC